MTIPIVLPMERETISKSVRESRARRREPSERGVQTSTSYGPGPCGTEPGLRSGWHSSSVTTVDHVLLAKGGLFGQGEAAAAATAEGRRRFRREHGV